MDFKSPTFSRAGRFCDERYNTEVTESRVLGINSKPFVRLETKELKPTSVEEAINEVGTSVSSPTLKKSKGSSAFLSPSREAVQRSKVRPIAETEG